MGDINPAALIVTLLSLGILILWEQGFMKRIKVFQIIQGPLVVVVLGIVASNLFVAVEGFSFAQDEMVGLPIASEEGGFLALLTFPDWRRAFREGSLGHGIYHRSRSQLRDLAMCGSNRQARPRKKRHSYQP